MDRPPLSNLTAAYEQAKGAGMALDDTGWRKPIVTTENGLPTATIVPATGLEKQPCFMCRSFDKDERKLRQYYEAHGLVPNTEGLYETPITQDFDNRKSLQVDVKNFGFCRRHDYVTDMRATCGDFQITTSRADLMRKIR